MCGWEVYGGAEEVGAAGRAKTIPYNYVYVNINHMRFSSKGIQESNGHAAIDANYSILYHATLYYTIL